MVPSKPLPYPDCWATPEDYVDNLLQFVTTSETFQILCSGVHVLDFFTTEPGLFSSVVPDDWQPWLLQCDPMRLLDVLMRDDLDSLSDPRPPESLTRYIRNIRNLSLAREYPSREEKLPKMTWQGTVGMKPKKIHEVRNFADYIDQLASAVKSEFNNDITHFVDFGSGQNYLGRALASAPYNKHIIAVEGRENNITGAKGLDIIARVAEKPKIMRNKKLWMQQLDNMTPEDQRDERALKRANKAIKSSADYVVDLRPRHESEAIYTPEEGKGFIHYIEARLESGDLAEVIDKLENTLLEPPVPRADLRLMAISIHSCGNLSHHGIRSLIINPAVQAIAIVGCCYNLLTEKLGPPTHKLPYLRPSLQALNGRVIRESSRCDPHGFPLSDRLCTYGDVGIRLNITARMMACQAPHNWTEVESDGFFTRHFFRAVLQKIFLDRGVVSKIHHDGTRAEDSMSNSTQSPFNVSTNPVVLGSLGKSCYKSLHAYVRGAITKLTTSSDYHEQRDIIKERMSDITDEEITKYESQYGPRKRELSAIWTLMAFSAIVVESLIVTDRWLFLRQHSDLVQDCWAEPVFDYRQSPRNLVIVGVKKANP
ncbi:methyltransferase domain-containing protein [Nemania sp. FL0916]|nr:methyltransferase domain-containing protein [Nemania sp. FL0916]